MLYDQLPVSLGRLPTLHILATDDDGDYFRLLLINMQNDTLQAAYKQWT